MTLWSAFYPYVLAEVPMAPEPLVDFMLRKAAIDFCEETAVHSIQADAIDVLAGTAVYPLVPPGVIIAPAVTAVPDPELDVCMVKYAWLNNQPLPYVSQEILNQQSTTYWRNDTGDKPTGFTQDDQDNLILYPNPTRDYTGTNGLLLTLVVRPSLAATGVKDWIGKRYVQEISYGAVAMLTGMVGKPWSNPEAEQKYTVKFEAAKTKATIDAYRSFTRGALRVQMSNKW